MVARRGVAAADATRKSHRGKAAVSGPRRLNSTHQPRIFNQLTLSCCCFSNSGISSVSRGSTKLIRFFTS